MKAIHYCPCCGAHGADNNKPMQSFRMSADFIGRLIAPILLDQTSAATENIDSLPRSGRKYIAFADSRQSAAGPTLKQNLETEEVWVTGVLVDKLNRNKDEVENEIINCSDDIEYYKNKNRLKEAEEKEVELSNLNNKKANGFYITWNEALDT